MKLIKEGFIIALLAAVLVLVLEVVYSIDRFRNAVVKTTPALVQKMDTDLDELHSILTQTYKITSDTRLTLDNVNKAAIDERFYFEKQVPLVTADVRNLIQTSDATIAGLQTISPRVGTLLDTANQTVAGIQPTEKSATDALVGLHTSLDLFNTTLSDPNIKTTMFNVAGITQSANHMLLTADQVETKATHSYLHPSTNPVHRTWDYLSPFLVPAATVASRIIP